MGKMLNMPGIAARINFSKIINKEAHIDDRRSLYIHEKERDDYIWGDYIVHFGSTYHFEKGEGLREFVGYICEDMETYIKSIDYGNTSGILDDLLDCYGYDYYKKNRPKSVKEELKDAKKEIKRLNDRVSKLENMIEGMIEEMASSEKRTPSSVVWN